VSQCEIAIISEQRKKQIKQRYEYDT